MTKSKVFIQVFIFLAIVVFVNLISQEVYFRLDFTADKRYTLSDATEKVVRDLDNVITVTAYFTENLPPQLAQTRNDFEDLLIEYEKLSDGNLVYQFISPNENEELEMEAQQKGIGPIIVNVTENDKVQQLRAYLGAILEMGDRQEVIPVIQPGASMEYALTTGIKKISIENKPKIGLLQGHGEAAKTGLSQVLEQLNVLYEVENYTINDTSDIPGYFKSVLIVDPKDSIPPSDLSKLDKYLTQGGNVLVAYSNVTGDLNKGQYLQKSPEIGIKSWLEEKGVSLRDQFVLDASSASVSVRQQQGAFILNSQIKFPYFPIVSNFAGHPITGGLEAVVLPFVSPIDIQADTTLSFEPLLYSSDLSGLASAPTMVDLKKRWTEDDFKSDPQVLGIAVEGAITSSGNSRMVVFSNGDFAVSKGQRQQRVNPDNVNLFTNSVDWLTDDTGLIDLRTKGVTARPLENVEESTKNMLKYGNVVMPIVLILIYAGIRRQRNLKKRQNWLQDNY
jgi:gliding-associated putative ABC transporter substrate-binding component GldG